MQISDRTHLSPDQSIKDLTVAELRTLIYLTSNREIYDTP